MSDFFVSYARRDGGEWAQWIAATLRDAGYKVYLDPMAAPPGRELPRALLKSLRGAKCLVAVLSPAYVESAYAQEELRIWYPRMRPVLALRIAPCEIPELLTGVAIADFVDVDETPARTELLKRARQVVRKRSNRSDAGLAIVPPFPGRPETRIALELPVTGALMVDRKRELSLLDDAWERQRARVVVIVGPGGEGKSHLVRHWAGRLLAAGSTPRTFGWSFHDKPDPDQFMVEALRFFGDSVAERRSRGERAFSLATLVGTNRSVLILDGFEGMQERFGGGRDRVILEFLTRLLELASSEGLCVITTRSRLPDLGRRARDRVLEIDLPPLAADDGALLLERLGVRGTQEERAAISRRVNGHALTLDLVGRRLVELYDGDPSRAEVALAGEPQEAGETVRGVVEHPPPTAPVEPEPYPPLAALAAVNPDAVRLAESVAFAVLVDRAFLRAARLRLTPAVDAGAEADLWFSPLVQSRTADGIVFHPEAADALRRRMPAERVEEVWELTCSEHAWLAPSLQLEERVAYLSVSRKPTASEDLAASLRSVLAAMVGGERAGLAQWAVRALAMFPSRVQELPEARMLDAGTRLRLNASVAATAADQPLPSWMPWLAPASLGTVPLDFELRDGELEIRTATEDRPVTVPKTSPLLLEVSWRDETQRRHARQVTFRTGETVTVAVGSRELVLRAVNGDEFELRGAGETSSVLRNAIVDFSQELQRHAEVVGRREEIEDVFYASERNRIIAVTGELGRGKTAFACELIREAERRGIPAFAHFFRFGDLRLESIAAAERSLIAQLAVRFGLPERMLDLRLGEVLQRLPRRRVLIVLDDVDEARNADRERFAGVMMELMDAAPDWITAVGTSAWEKETAHHVHRLQPPAQRDGLPETAAEIRKLFDLPPGLRGGLLSVMVALRPLPERAFYIPPGSYPARELLRFERDEVRVVSDVARARVLDAIGTRDVARAHLAFVHDLARHREDERIDRYYLTNASWHLLEAGEVHAAIELCTNFRFMRAKIARFGVYALIADYRKLARPQHTELTRKVLATLGEYQDAIEEAPDDLAPILRTALVAADLSANAIGDLPPQPLVPKVLRKSDLGPRRPRRHYGPVRGSQLYAEPAEARNAIETMMLATWSDDGTILLWPRGVDRPVELLDAGAPVTAFTVSWPWGIAVDANGFLHAWNLYAPASSEVRVAAHDGPIDGMLVDGARRSVITWAGNEPVRFWSIGADVLTIEPAGELPPHSSPIAGCALMPGGELLVTVSRGGMCRLWSVGERRLLGSAALSAPATGIAFHWDAQSRLVMTAKRALEVVQVGGSTLTVSSHTTATGHDLPVSGVAFSPDGLSAATWSEDQTIRLWDVPMAGAARLVIRDHRAAITAFRFLANRPWLVSADAAGVAMVHSRDSGAPIARFDGHLRAIRTIALDGDTVFTAGDDGIVMQWSAADGGLILDRSKPKGRIEECLVQGSGAVLTSDGEWELRIGEETPPVGGIRPAILSKPGGFLFSAAFQGWDEDAPDGRRHSAYAVAADTYAAIGTIDGSVLVKPLDSSRTTVLGTLGDRISALAFGYPTLLVAVAVNGSLVIWDVRRRQLLHRVQGHRARIHALAAFERYAATGSADGMLRIWDLDTGRAITIEHAHESAITALRMEGNIVVSASVDRTIRVFDAKLGTGLAVCRGHRDAITGIAIAMTDEAIYSCSSDRTIRRWDLATGAQTAAVYTTAPLRCISWRDGTLAAGDDAGNLWTVEEAQAAVERKTRVNIRHAPVDTALAERLARDLAREGIAVAFGPLGDAPTVVVIVTPESLDAAGVHDAFDDAITTGKRVVTLHSVANRFDVTSRWPNLKSFESVQLQDRADEKSYGRALRQLVATIRSKR